MITNEFTDKDILKYIYSGEAILVTGAGFDRSFENISGKTTPSGSELHEMLWETAFPGKEYQSNIKLSMVYDKAYREDPEKHKKILKDAFHINPQSIHERFEDWLLAPWNSVYTFNVDDAMDSICARNSQLSEMYEVKDGLVSKFSSEGKKNLVQIHGKISNYPNLTFTEQQYRSRINDIDVWYTNFANDLSHNRVFFVGTALNEPALEYYLEALGPDLNNKRRSYPAFFISPGELNLEDELKLEDYNIRHLSMTEEEFYNKYIYQKVHEYWSNKKPISEGVSIHNIADLIQNSTICSDDYLEGRSPEWGDLKNDYMIEFDCVQEIIDKTEKNKFVLVRGSAGSGKTSALMQVARKLSQEKYNVGWVDKNSEKSVPDIVKEANNSDFDFIIIDDLGKYSGRGLVQFKNIKKNVISSIRSSRVLDLYGQDDLENVETYNLLNLSPEDSQKLVNMLDQRKKLGKYLLASRTNSPDALTVKMAKDKILNKLKFDQNRFLLSTMILASTGKRFEEYVSDECEEIQDYDKSTSQWQQKLNATIAFLSRVDDVSITEKDLFIICDPLGASPKSIKESLESLLSRKIVLKSSDNSIKSRHAVIAEESLNYYKKIGILPEIIFSIAKWAYANYDRRNIANKHFKVLQKCINHKELNKLTNNIEVTESIYDRMREYLDDYFHYWLQRGSFETEIGTDIGYSKAANSFGYAYDIDPDNFNLLTAFHYLQLKRSIQTIHLMDSQKRALESIDSLCDAIGCRPEAKDSPNTVVVLLNNSLACLNSGKLDEITKMDVANKCYRAGMLAMGKEYTQNRLVKKAWERFDSWVETEMPLIKNSHIKNR